jgi:hypothetical protein
MTNQQSGTEPSAATRSEEEREATAAHNAGRGPTAEEDRAAPGADEVSDETRRNYEEMRKLGANDEGEGKLP